MLQRLTNFLVNLRQEGTINNWSFCAKFDALTLSHVILSNGLEWLQLHFASGDIEAKKNGQNHKNKRTILQGQLAAIGGKQTDTKINPRWSAQA